MPFRRQTRTFASLIPYGIAYKLCSFLDRSRSMLNLNAADSKFFERDAPVGRIAGATRIILC